MSIIKTTYLGDLRTESIHVASGMSLLSDAPKDNQGKGATFSPTDLLATSLSTCMLTVMGIAARKHGINIEGTYCSVDKKMASNPRKISTIQVEIHFPEGQHYSEAEKSILEHAALNCPVALSLHPDIHQEAIFHFT